MNSFWKHFFTTSIRMSLRHLLHLSLWLNKTITLIANEKLIKVSEPKIIGQGQQENASKRRLLDTPQGPKINGQIVQKQYPPPHKHI